jgi:hypothetical protein
MERTRCYVGDLRLKQRSDAPCSLSETFSCYAQEREHSHSHSHSHNGVPCTADHSLSPLPASGTTSQSLVPANQQPHRVGDTDEGDMSNWAMISRMFKWLVEGPGGITRSAACLTLIILTKVSPPPPSLPP